jgi:hypothetical protein
MAGVRAAGSSGEQEAGIIKNTDRIPSLSGTAAYRIPDELNSSVLGEVKNVSGLSYTNQTLTGQPGTPQGTATESVTGNASQVITRRYYDPYGNPAGSPVSWPDDLGYAGRPADAVSGLDLLGRGSMTR